MINMYINGISSVSPQPEDIFDHGNPREYKEHILPALAQDYQSMIKPMLLRRMSTAVKMGLFCSKKALMDAGLEIIDAIFVGTGQGCLQDTEKFMSNMLKSKEGLQSPTSFIQSTHNTVSGQIALDLRCNGHNMTFTQSSVSFESALLDVSLQMRNENVRNVLVGGVDEISKETSQFQKLDGQVKEESPSNLDLFKSNTSGTIISESAAFFSLSSEKSSNSYAQFKDVEIFNRIEDSSLGAKILQFLKRNKICVSEIDAIIVGRNGDVRFDHYYDELQEGIFSDMCQLGYKHLVGEHNSVSSYAFWLASKILKEQKISEIFKLNTLNCRNPRNILIYNQYLGRNHGLILLQKP